MVDDRVEYFESNDLLYGHNFNKIETIKIPDISQINVNDAIEFYEIKRYFDNGTQLNTWSDEEYERYKAKSKKLYELTFCFFNAISDTTIIECYLTTDHSYRKEFWALLNKCKLYDKISDDIFGTLIHTDGIAPFDIFRHKNIVNRYGAVLRSYIIECDKSIRILMHVYEQDYTHKEKLFLPNELLGADTCSCLERYIDSASPNVNTLNSIVQMRSSQMFPISDELRLKAKRQYAKEIEKLSHTGVSFEHGIQLVFSLDQREEKIAEHNGRDFKVSYSTSWLLDTLDYPSILNNFIYIFDYVDIPQMRSQHVSKKADLGTFERILHTESSRIYPCSSGFSSVNGLATMQMNAYYNFLKGQKLRLEDVLKWFFVEYLQSEYNCPEIRVSFPSESSSYVEKCSTIITAFESILKQYSLYVKNGEIDFELLGMSTTPITFEGVSSLVEQKYIYGGSKEYTDLTFMLFSDQCMFSHVHHIYEEKKAYENFVDLILHENVYLSDYKEHEHLALKRLSDYNLIEIAPNGLITMKSKVRVAILRDLYKNEVASKWHYPSTALSEIQELVDQGVLSQKRSLLSIPEASYLNYLLNRSEYDNGLEIRNKYVHGIQQVNPNENDHMHNYLILLQVFVLLAIKINDDFELKEIVEEMDNIN